MKAGSRVRYAPDWLASLGTDAHRFTNRRGTIECIRNRGRDIPPPLAVVRWDDGKTGLAILTNLTDARSRL